VVAGIHSGLNQSEEKMTERILNVMSKDNVDGIAHPTGRLLQKRDQSKINFDKVYEAAEEKNISLEVNAFPSRLDLPDIELRKARTYDIKFHLGTDSHSVDHLRYMKFGVSTSRRGWLEEQDIINTRGIDELRNYLNI
jgi:DNA polymerase (family 10)